MPRARTVLSICGLSSLLRQVGEGLRGLAGGERLVMDVPAHVPAAADPARVAQVVGNLLENALRYASDRPIVLRATAAPADGGLVRVAAADQGPGIATSEQARIWEPFYRGQGVAGLNVARGSGIGLTVVKALVEAQGGRVGLDSTPGRGATFWVELPSPPGGGSASSTGCVRQTGRG
jgi:signal transduction histidine kinase